VGRIYEEVKQRPQYIVRELRGQAEGIQRVPTVVRWLRDFPELLLLALALFALVLAAMRALLTRGHSP